MTEVQSDHPLRRASAIPNVAWIAGVWFPLSSVAPASDTESNPAIHRMQDAVLLNGGVGKIKIVFQSGFDGILKSLVFSPGLHQIQV